MRVVIPARYASTRLPGKPLKLLAGKPMLQHVHEKAIASGAEQVVIATDDDRIREAALGFDAEVCMTSSDHQTGTDRLAEVVEAYQWADDEVVVNLQGDEPLMPTELVQQVAQILQNDDKAVTSTLSTPLRNEAQITDENTVKVVTDHAGYALYFSRAPIPWVRGELKWDTTVDEALLAHYQRHIGLYAYRVGFVKKYVSLTSAPLEQLESLEQLRMLWHGYRIVVAVAEEAPVAGVDTEEDLERVDLLLREMS